MDKITAPRRVREGKRSFNLVVGGFSHLISAGIAFFLTPFLIGRLGVEIYGFYPTALEAVAITGLLTGLLNSTAARYIAVEMAGGRVESAGGYFSAVFRAERGLLLILSIPVTLLIVFCDSFFDIPAGMTGQIRLFLTLIFAAGFTDALTAVFGAAYTVSNRLDFRAAQELAAVAVKALLLWFLLGGTFPVSIVSVGAAVLASSLTGAAIRLFMAKWLVPELFPIKRGISFSCLKRVLASGVWYSVNELGGWLSTGAFLILANLFYGAADAGVYSVAVTASRFFGGVMAMLAGTFIPTAARQFAKGERKDLGRDVVKGEKLVGFFALVGVSLTVGFLREFFDFWLGEQNTPLLRLLTVFAILPILSVAATLPIFNLAVVMDRLKRISLLCAGGSLFGTAAALALAAFTDTGILGLAVISFAVRVLWYSAFMPFVAGRLLRMSPLVFYVPVLRTYVGAAVSVLLIFAVKSFCRFSSLFSLLIGGGVCLCAVLVIGFFCVFGRVKFRI